MNDAFDAKLYSRLLSRILEPANEQDCWRCTLSRNRKGGYCQLQFSDRSTKRRFKRYAHVVMFELFNGPVPEGHEVDHRCWDGACIHPDHLRALPQSKNRARNQHVRKFDPGFSKRYTTTREQRQ